MDMYQSEKNWLEKLADAIPGVKDYREKEARRDTDKRFREYLAKRIDASRTTLDEIKREQLNAGNLAELDDVDLLSQKLFRIANTIRHASYGYAGFFDQVKIQEAELDRIYQYDLSLVSDVEALENGLKSDPTLTHAEQRKKWEQQIAALEKRIEDRKNLFTVTG
jgi:DNA-binding XRE family transcriptional regulator